MKKLAFFRKTCVLLLIFIILCSIVPSGKYISHGEITEEEAIEIADLWYIMELNSGYVYINESEKIERFDNLKNREVLYQISGNKILEKTPKDDKVLAFIFRYEPSGFVIVSGSDRIQPIIAFDVKSDFKLTSPEENALIDFLYFSVPLRWENIGSNLHHDWRLLRSKLQKNGKIEEISFDNPGDSMYVHWETANWSQFLPYNEVVADKNANLSDPPNYNIPTGCTATALAIKFRFHEWPITGYDSHSYNDNSGSIQFNHSVNFGAYTYNWDNMPTMHLNETNSKPSERLDVATLMYHCGVAVNMNYEERASGGHHVTENVEKYFRYKGTEYIEGLGKLFDIDRDDFEDDLDNAVNTGVVSYELLQEFIDNGYPLSNDLVIKDWGDWRWIIIDNGTDITYIFGIITAEDVIRVFRLMESEMVEKIKASIIGGLPVFCGSISHSMIVDGYRNTEHPFVHVNDGNFNIGWIDLFLNDTGIHGAWIENIRPFCSPINYIYVDPSYRDGENGYIQTPFDTFSEGYNVVPDGGHLWLRTDTYNIAPITLDKPLTIHAYQGEGAVTLPKYKPINTPFLNFLENHPHLFPLLRQLLRL